MTNTQQCDCDSWCDECSVKFVLKAECLEEERTIFAHDLEVTGGGENVAFAREDTVLDGLVDQSERGVVLVHMKQGQVLHFEAIAVKGVGKLHAKWSPVSTVTFQYLPSIILNYPLLAEFTDQEKRDWIRTCPARVFDITDHDVSVVRPDACVYCDECVKEGKFILAAKRKPDPLEKPVAAITQRRNPETGGYDFKFTVETTGVMEAEKVVRSALNVLHTKLSIIRDSYYELKKTLEEQ
jgi:DNA-directed RNA polymerase II subunit RPB3